ncbi:hypothetical protein AWB78_06955 [Caballeronia calidae]|uniref:DUF3331 domain-containing protein n=1 Tax=Caballeronia calidae TaxID=1777139 RepID=A0A158ECG6_9BURK|nr:hypothetical protein AWB78_06955 [Caballeronia calidae]
MDGDGTTSFVAWEHMVGVLQGVHDARLVSGRKHAAMQPFVRDRSPQSSNAHIQVLERLTDRSVIILWEDSTRCRYVDQVWTCCRARRTGQCAMTGAVISRDDIVYKPRSKRGFPGNGGAMILASVIAGMSLTG